MLLRAIWAVICIASVLLSAGTAAADGSEKLTARFDPDAWTAPELGFLQTALAFEGRYRGPIDGRWGEESRQALVAYAAARHGGQPTERDIVQIGRDLIAELVLGGWELRHLPELNISMAFPARLADAPIDEDGRTRWWSRSGDFGILAGQMDDEETHAWHAAALEVAADLHMQRASGRMVTAGRLVDGRLFHSHSRRAGAAWSTIFVVAEPGAANRLSLIAASLASDLTHAWTRPESGYLARLLAAGDAAPPADAAAQLPEADVSPNHGWHGTGSGFFVNRTDLVTAWHVVAGCETTTLDDGTELALIAGDPERDLAVLAASRPAADWLAVGAPAELRLGQPVQALGYPYYALAGTALNLTSGNVSALAGIGDDRRFVSLSAPVQPGSSGGPVLGRDGRVVGVVVARLSERFISDATGSLPQNVNYAATSDELVRFLRLHGRRFQSAPPAPASSGDGLSASAARAIVPVICW